MLNVCKYIMPTVEPVKKDIEALWIAGKEEFYRESSLANARFFKEIGWVGEVQLLS
ncbi:MAG: hypothetical protein ABRQ25_18965 [Clostridiaceae bacterium]